MISYKKETIKLLLERGEIESKSAIDCSKDFDRIAKEKLFTVCYINTKGKIITLSKALYAIKAWRKAYQKLINL